MHSAWHREHVLGRSASQAERVIWHRAHQKHCACRPVPASLQALVDQAPEAKAKPKRTNTKPRASTKTPAAPEGRANTVRASVQRHFEQVVEVLGKEPGTSFGGKGFASGALRHRGKIFAMVDARGAFVVKLPRARADELVKQKLGKPFETSPGRIMKEWVTVQSGPSTWIALAREAMSHAKQREKPRS